MARKDSSPKVDRRRFLTGAVAAGAATAVTPRAGVAQSGPEVEAAKVPAPSFHVAAAETSTPGENGEQSRIKGVAGSDFMVDVIKTLNIKYLPANCASSFRGIHES